jgi:hypothetical protein
LLMNAYARASLVLAAQPSLVPGTFSEKQ